MSAPAHIEGWEKLHFHFFTQRRLEKLRRMWGDVSVHSEPPSLVEVSEGAITPSSMNGRSLSGVYDRNNSLVVSSARIRGKNSRADDDPAPEVLLGAVRDSRAAYYLGRGASHYGHFILETLCRAWAWQKHGADRIAVLQWMPPSYARVLLGLIPGLLERAEVVRVPKRFQNVVVPGAAFVIAQKAHVQFKGMCEQMAERAIGKQLVVEQPLYLSRAGLARNRRTIEGEDRLERLLDREGFRVVRPETLSIPEQIALVNRHRWIVASWGSACHTRLFSQTSNEMITITPHYFTPNYVLCDLLCAGRSHYVNALATPQIGTSQKLMRFVEPEFLDENRVLDFLKQLGLVRATAAFDGPPPNLNEYKLRWIAMARAQSNRKPHERDRLSKAIDEVSTSFESD